MCKNCLKVNSISWRLVVIVIVADMEGDLTLSSHVALRKISFLKLVFDLGGNSKPILASEKQATFFLNRFSLHACCDPIN